jgi:para-aminobenzoate synthetase/4-amino-4-deoxychorismate lyase
MTSTVRADLREELKLEEIFSALYPCGSITGAPKRRTMQIIRELEVGARGPYTGAIGWFDVPQDGRSTGDFCLSVPIRTLALQAPHDGIRRGELGVGAGIVHDSRAVEELAECRLKAQFLTGLAHGFELFETMHASRSHGCRHFTLHMQRLQASAEYFGFVYDANSIRENVRRACEALAAGIEYRLRLALSEDGACSIETTRVAPLQAPVRILLATEPTSASDLFLRHKTTVRDRYDRAWREAEAQGAFDMVFCNEHGELTEGARSNLFIKLDGCWYTPPLSAGVLPGVMRAVLLADAEWNAQERCLVPEDLRQAQNIVVCNALRGALPATVI